MQMRHISALIYMLPGSEDDLCYITDHDDISKVKWEPEILRLINISAYCMDSEAQ